MPAKTERPSPRVGSVFVKEYKGKRYILKVIRADGNIAYETDKTAFGSPTAAAKSITKTEVNGWKFWKIE